MTPAEKPAVIARVRQIIEEQIKLENHYAREQRDAAAIDFTRLNVYVQIVNSDMGPGTMK